MYCKLGLCHVFIVYCNTILFLYFQNIPNQFQQRNLLNSACLIWFIQWLWLFFWLIVVSIVLFYDLNIMHALRRKCVTQSGVEKLYNNTHQTQTKVGQMTDQYAHIIECTLDIYFQKLIWYMLPYKYNFFIYQGKMPKYSELSPL